MLSRSTEAVDIVGGVARRADAGPRRAQTSRKLVEAAMEVVAEHGFHSATVDAIAERAGFSIGALYSNFSGKDELLFAVFDEHVRWFERRLAEVAVADDAGRAAADWLTSLGKDPEQILVFVEFWAYAVRKPDVRREFAKRMTEMRAAVADAVERRSAETGAAPALDPNLLALLALATARGLALEKLANPRAVPDDTVGELLAGLLG
jgi:AcrR family transcriptional regulator